MKPNLKNIPQTEPVNRIVPKKGPGSENATRARACLNQEACPKEWAQVLGFSVEYVRMLMREERTINEATVQMIARGMMIFRLRARDLETWAERMLLEQYGPNDPGGF